MKKNDVKNKIKLSSSKIIGAVAILFNFLFIISLIILNVLPNKFLIPIIVVFLGVDIVIVIFSFFKKAKRKKKIGISILSIIWAIISLTGSIYLLKTISFIGGVGAKGYKTENYSVIVLKDSSYNKIENINNKELGIVSYNSEGKDKAKEHINSKIKVSYKEFETPQALESALLNKDIEVIMVEDSYLDMFKEINTDFESLTKVIYNFSVKIKEEDITKDVSVSKEPFSIYISGIDTYGKISSVSRSDVNIVATVNPNTNKILLISIPRDYYVKLHGTTGYNDKLTHAGMYGVDMSVKTIEDLLGIDINYYAKVNFSSVIKIVDVLGGVDVNSEYTFTSYSGYRFNKGYNHMNGEQALDFARTRKAFATGDRQRGKNQQAVIEALIKKGTSSAVITKYNSLLDSLAGTFQTNLSNKEISSLAKYQLEKMPLWTVESISLDGGDDYNYTYSYGKYKAYVMEPYESSIKDAQAALEEILGKSVRKSSYSKSTTSTSKNVDTSKNNDYKTDLPKEEISLNSHDITVNIGDVTLLTVTPSNNNIIWSSSDDEVATVSNGSVKALKTGTITITAQLGNSKDTCIVRINNPIKHLLPEDKADEDDKEDNAVQVDDNDSQQSNIEVQCQVVLVDPKTNDK